jgi:hypothetical protein
VMSPRCSVIAPGTLVVPRYHAIHIYGFT